MITGSIDRYTTVSELKKNTLCDNFIKLFWNSQLYIFTENSRALDSCSEHLELGWHPVWCVTLCFHFIKFARNKQLFIFPEDPRALESRCEKIELG